MVVYRLNYLPEFGFWVHKFQKEFSLVLVFLNKAKGIPRISEVYIFKCKKGLKFYKALKSSYSNTIDNWLWNHGCRNANCASEESEMYQKHSKNYIKYRFRLFIYSKSPVCF